MDKINPAQYITDTDPIDQSAPKVSRWFSVGKRNIRKLTPAQLGYELALGYEISSMRYDDCGLATGTLRRKEIETETVLANLIEDYVDAYNEGRTLNDSRYDELVTIYTATLDKAEDEFSALEADDTVYDGLIETIIGQLGTDFTSFETDVDGKLDDYGESIRLQINTRFDNQLATARQDLVDKGLYNSTTYASMSTGIERDRTLALTDMEDKIISQQLGLSERIYAGQTQMRGAILAARDRLRATIHGAANARLESRNATMQAMAGFMERRTDGYPDLSEVGNLAAALGTGQATAFAP